jgi:hypothetical protein
MNEGRDRDEREHEAREPEASRERESRSLREGESDRGRQGRGRDVMHGRDFAGTSIFSTEREQTLDAERAKRGVDSTDEFVTEAELNARENRAQGNED